MNSLYLSHPVSFNWMTIITGVDKCKSIVNLYGDQE